MPDERRPAGPRYGDASPTAPVAVRWAMLDRQTLAALRTATAKDRLTGPVALSSAEPVPTMATAILRLICPLHGEPRSWIDPPVPPRPVVENGRRWHDITPVGIGRCATLRTASRECQPLPRAGVPRAGHLPGREPRNGHPPGPATACRTGQARGAERRRAVENLLQAVERRSYTPRRSDRQARGRGCDPFRRYGRTRSRAGPPPHEVVTVFPGARCWRVALRAQSPRWQRPGRTSPVHRCGEPCGYTSWATRWADAATRPHIGRDRRIGARHPAARRASDRP